MLEEVCFGSLMDCHPSNERETCSDTLFGCQASTRLMKVDGSLVRQVCDLLDCAGAHLLLGCPEPTLRHPLLDRHPVFDYHLLGSYWNTL